MSAMIFFVFALILSVAERPKRQQGIAHTISSQLKRQRPPLDSRRCCNAAPNHVTATPPCGLNRHSSYPCGLNRHSSYPRGLDRHSSPSSSSSEAADNARSVSQAPGRPSPPRASVSVVPGPCTLRPAYARIPCGNTWQGTPSQRSTTPACSDGRDTDNPSHRQTRLQASSPPSPPRQEDL